MKLIIGSLLVALIGLAVVAHQTLALQVEHVEVDITDLPVEFEGFRIALISDLHGVCFAPEGRLAREVAESLPDLVAIAGDFVHHRTADIHNVTPLVRALVGVAPVFAVSGNHDHAADWSYIAGHLSQLGVHVLENSHVTIDRGEGRLILAGVSDPYSRHDDLGRALPANVSDPVILLAHAPTWFEPPYIEQFSGTAPFSLRRDLLSHVSLTLVGHTHGGQIKLPFLGAVTTASGRLFPKTHIEGLLQEEHGWLYITRGVGQGGLLPLRFLSRPELTIITLRSPMSERP